jgi:hypothetical protein
MSRIKPLLAVCALLAVVYVAAQVSPLRSTTPAFTGRTSDRIAQATAAPAETFRLIQARGNEENEAARGLSRAECDRRRDELKIVATQLGTYNEAQGIGSITCLPESAF